MSSVSDTSIINAALLEIGAEPLPSFSDASGLGDLVPAQYNLLLESRLESYPWRFALRTATLTSLGSSVHAAQSDYDYFYRVPTDCLRVIGLLDPFHAPFERFGDELHTSDHASGVLTVDVLYISLVAISFASKEFCKALAKELAAELAVPIKEDRALKATLQADAERWWSQARVHDAQASFHRGMSLVSRLLELTHGFPSSRR